MKHDRVIEIAFGIVVCVTLLRISSAVAIPILSSGIGGLRTYFDSDCESTVFLMLFVAVSFIACSDVPERIRHSYYLSGQAILLAATAFVIYVTLRFLINLPRIGTFTGSAVIGITALFGLTSVVRVIRTILPAMGDRGE
jgi:4-amino-4-deoxy-L-arabinose transferase-like glycosyltransferase